MAAAQSQPCGEGRFSTIFNRRGTEEGLWHSCFLTQAPARAGK
jgi:hypothetical protein